MKLLEQDDNCTHLISGADNFVEIQDAARMEVNRIRRLFKEEPETLITDARYGFIAGALKETMKKSGKDPGLTRSQKIDSILTNKYLGLPIFLGFLWLMFHATFTLGNYPMGWIESGVEFLGKFVKSNLSEGMFRDLIGGRSDRGCRRCDRFSSQYPDPFLFHLPDGGYRLYGANGLHHG